MTKYVFAKNSHQEKNTVYINNLDDLVDVFNYSMDEAALPCYMYRMTRVGDEDRGADIHDIVQMLCEEEDNCYMVAFSVTSEESRYEDWLAAAGAFPDASVCIANRGTYEVAFICVPTALAFQ
jgi:hypothetical protein